MGVVRTVSTGAPKPPHRTHETQKESRLGERQTRGRQTERGVDHLQSVLLAMRFDNAVNGHHFEQSILRRTGAQSLSADGPYSDLR
jgi:hypothetical protein